MVGLAFRIILVMPSISRSFAKKTASPWSRGRVKQFAHSHYRLGRQGLRSAKARLLDSPHCRLRRRLHHSGPSGGRTYCYPMGAGRHHAATITPKITHQPRKASRWKYLPRGQIWPGEALDQQNRASRKPAGALFRAGRMTNARGRPRAARKSGSLAVLAAMRRASSQILRVLSSFPSLFRLQRWTELTHSSAGGGEARGVLPCRKGCAP